ncbi:endo-1,4-beta-xylanase [Rheinheimera hassiensis]|uniref:endo-1,4-beta-xylanase n=1 Tax=Rheinheimera hassiensis TaxID=1193627 RepID=UPI001F063B0E|nr:endo-1,4-beta-xylanase [Rheinheimera hassiensis]
MLSRRQFVQSLLGLGVAAAMPAALAKPATTLPGNSAVAALLPGTEVPSLNQIASAAGRLFGSAFDMASINDPQYGSLLKHHCGVLTTDYQFKFGTLRWRENEISFTKTDQLMAFARAAGIPVRGHTLIWNEWNPDWLKQASDSRVAYWLERHIEEVVGRYAGQVHSWDVVNEPMWPGHNRESGLRAGPWLRAMGPDYIKRAFDVTARTDPAAKRVLNEAWLDRADHWGRGLRAAFLPLLDNLLDQGTPIDAIGLQCHLAPGNLDMDAFLQLVEQLQQRQLPVYITELDVNDQSFVDDEAQRDQQVASTYRDFLQEVLQNPVVEMVQTWQLSDKYSFYQGRQERLVRVLPFDRDMRAKPAYQALATTLAIPRHG